MTTVVDPASPTPVYNRSGTTIATMAAKGLDKSAAAPIVRVSGWTVVLVSSDANNAFVVLPSDAEIGDLVEVHSTSAGIGVVLLPSLGGNIGVHPVDEPVSVLPNNGRLFRKITSTHWEVVGSEQ